MMSIRIVEQSFQRADDRAVGGDVRPDHHVGDRGDVHVLPFRGADDPDIVGAGVVDVGDLAPELFGVVGVVGPAADELGDEPRALFEPGVGAADIEDFAAAGFGLGSGTAAEAGEARLPFTFDRLAVYEPCGNEGWVRLTLGGEGEAPAMTRISMALMNEDGTVSAEITNMVYRAGKQAEETPRTSPVSELYIPTWKEEQLS